MLSTKDIGVESTYLTDTLLTSPDVKHQGAGKKPTPAIKIAVASQKYCYEPELKALTVSLETEQLLTQTTISKINQLSSSSSGSTTRTSFLNFDNMNDNINSMAVVLMYIINHILPEQLAALGKSAEAESEIMNITVAAVGKMSVITMKLAEESYHTAIHGAAFNLVGSVTGAVGQLFQGAGELKNALAMGDTLQQTLFRDKASKIADTVATKVKDFEKQMQDVGLDPSKVDVYEIGANLGLTKDQINQIRQDLEIEDIERGAAARAVEIKDRFDQNREKMLNPDNRSTESIEDLNKLLDEIKANDLSRMVTPNLELGDPLVSTVPLDERFRNVDRSALKLNLPDNVKNALVAADGTINPLVAVTDPDGSSSLYYLATPIYDDNVQGHAGFVASIYRLNKQNKQSDTGVAVGFISTPEHPITRETLSRYLMSTRFMLTRNEEIAKVLSIPYTVDFVVDDTALDIVRTAGAFSSQTSTEALRNLIVAKAQYDALKKVSGAVADGAKSVDSNDFISQGKTDPMGALLKRIQVRGEQMRAIGHLLYGTMLLFQGGFTSQADSLRAKSELLNSLVRITASLLDLLTQVLKMCESWQANVEQVMSSVLSTLEGNWQAANNATRSRMM